MKLSAWFARTNTSKTAFAKMIGVSRGAVYAYLRTDPEKRKTPTPERMKRISEVTEQLVQPNDFCGVVSQPLVPASVPKQNKSNKPKTQEVLGESTF